eukprot:m.38617 g.38617  ORF g.38617 m.38617 type:complete len:257 (-) comp5516_c0_seq3:131-901(-)
MTPWLRCVLHDSIVIIFGSLHHAHVPDTHSYAEQPDALFPFLPLEISSSFFDALVLLSKCRVKRLPLVDDAVGDIVNIVSQSSMVHLLCQHIGQFRELADQALGELGLATPKLVHSIHAEQSVHTAFALIKKSGVSAVPVLGESNELIGNISARHAFYVVLAPNKLRLLQMSATAFLRATQDAAELGMDLKANISNSAITCTATDTLAHIISRMDSAHIHRIYLLGESGSLDRVLSLCDVLEAFVTSTDDSSCVQQ